MTSENPFNSRFILGKTPFFRLCATSPAHYFTLKILSRFIRNTYFQNFEEHITIMIKFNLLSLSFAAVLVTISLGSTQAYIEVIPERNQNDDGYVAPPVPAPSVTSAPVPSVTSAPVPSVTSAPVPSVTSAPVPSVSPAPTSDPCTSNEDGSFGNTSGDVIEIKYDYEMVTVANTDIAYTLSELEKSIADAVLGSSYVTCGINRNLAAGLRRRQLTIIGMNSEPEERITGDGESTHE